MSVFVQDTPSSQKRASPGIEPRPLAPEASILPLNYEAFLLFLFPFFHFPSLPYPPPFPEKIKGTTGFEPVTTGTAVLCSTTELCALLITTITFS